MPDLTTQIRERLNAGPVLSAEECPRAAEVNAWISEAYGALMDVLDLHHAEAHECPENDPIERSFTAYRPTCPTLLAVAEKLGIEIPEDAAVSEPSRSDGLGAFHYRIAPRAGGFNA